MFENGFRLTLKKEAVDLVHLCLHKNTMRGIVKGAMNFMVPQMVRNILTS
jgi:hypothetical protein